MSVLPQTSHCPAPYCAARWTTALKPRLCWLVPVRMKNAGRGLFLVDLRPAFGQNWARGYYERLRLESCYINQSGSARETDSKAAS